MLLRQSIARNEGPGLWPLGIANQPRSSLQCQRACGDYNNVKPQFQPVLGTSKKKRTESLTPFLTPAQASAIIQAQKVYLKMETPVGYQILLALSMQMFGLGLAGMAYRYIVEPPHMVGITFSLIYQQGLTFFQIWPSTLANAALFETLHRGANPIADGWKVSRYRFFMYAFIGSFCWYWLPGYIFTGISTFAFICWAAPSMFRTRQNEKSSPYTDAVLHRQKGAQ